MKNSLIAILLSTAFLATACSEADHNEKSVPVTLANVQGAWELKQMQYGGFTVNMNQRGQNKIQYDITPETVRFLESDDNSAIVTDFTYPYHLANNTLTYTKPEGGGSDFPAREIVSLSATTMVWNVDGEVENKPAKFRWVMRRISREHLASSANQPKSFFAYTAPGENGAATSIRVEASETNMVSCYYGKDNKLKVSYAKFSKTDHGYSISSTDDQVDIETNVDMNKLTAEKLTVESQINFRIQLTKEDGKKVKLESKEAGAKCTFTATKTGMVLRTQVSCQNVEASTSRRQGDSKRASFETDALCVLRR